MKNNFQFLIYRSAEEDISVDAFIKDDTIWLTQKGMAKLFDCTTDNISFHLKNIYAEGELDETATAEESSVVQMEGSRTDIFAECSIDYDRDSPLTHDFYAMVQNKFHYAITGQTAAEIVYTKADHTKDHMGLTTWKNAPDGRVLKLDVSVAKNYLSEKQIRQLKRAVSGYFDYIEDLIERENTFTMEQFASSINEFLSFRRYDVLPDKGKVTNRKAREKAEAEYAMFNPTQKIVSDFDKAVKKLKPE